MDPLPSLCYFYEHYLVVYGCYLELIGRVLASDVFITWLRIANGPYCEPRVINDRACPIV